MWGAGNPHERRRCWRNGSARYTTTGGAASQGAPEAERALRAARDRLRAAGPPLAQAVASADTESDAAGGWRVDLTTDDVSGAALLRISNPSKRNAMNGPMIAMLSDIVADLRRRADTSSAATASPAGSNEDASSSMHEDMPSGPLPRLLLVAGDSDTFCAGADLSLAASAGADLAADMSAVMHDALGTLRRLPIVSVAVVCGAAVGGGAELTTAMDFRVAHPEATVQFVHALMGLTPGWGGGTRLTRILGREQALLLLGSATKLSATDAAQRGLVDFVGSGTSGLGSASDVGPGATDVDADDGALVPGLDPTSPVLHALRDCGPRTVQTAGAALHMCSGMLTKDTAVLGALKRVVAGADELPLREALAHEAHVFRGMWGGPANAAALARVAAARQNKEDAARDK